MQAALGAHQTVMDRSHALKRTLSCNAVIALSCFAALCVAMVFNSLTQYLNQDEEQYVTAAYLAQHMRLYTDFLYLQPPIYPLVLSKLLMLFPGWVLIGCPSSLCRTCDWHCCRVFQPRCAPCGECTVRLHTRVAIRVGALDAEGLWLGAQ